MINLRSWLSGLLIAFVLLTQAKSSSPESCLLFSISSFSKGRLGIVNTNRQSANLKITNKNGDTFFEKTVPGNKNYFQLINLSKLPDDKYSVKLTISDKEFSKRFVIKDTKAEIPPPPVRHAPIFKQLDNEVLFINYQNSFDELVNIFFMQNDEVVFEERGLKDENILKKYSLKQIPHGSYIVKIYSGSKIYTHPLEKK